MVHHSVEVSDMYRAFPSYSASPGALLELECHQKFGALSCKLNRAAAIQLVQDCVVCTSTGTYYTSSLQIGTILYIVRIQPPNIITFSGTLTIPIDLFIYPPYPAIIIPYLPIIIYQDSHPLPAPLPEIIVYYISTRTCSSYLSSSAYHEGLKYQRYRVLIHTSNEQQS